MLQNRRKISNSILTVNINKSLTALFTLACNVLWLI